MPPEIYPDKYYPPFVTGPIYMLTGNVIERLVETVDNYSGKILDLEDVSITGIIADKCGVARHHNSLLKFIGCSNVCPLHNAIAVFMCNGSENMKQFWKDWINSSHDKCLKKVQVKSTSKSGKKEQELKTYQENTTMRSNT